MKISATTKTWLEDICDFYQRQNCSTNTTMLSFSQRVMKIKIEVFLPTLASIILSYYSYFWEWNDNFSCSQSEIVIFNFHLFFLLSTSSKLPSARCPTSQISSRSCCHYLIPFFWCLTWVTVGWSRHCYLQLTDEESIFSLLSKLLKMYFLGLQSFSLLSWVPSDLGPSLLIIWNLHQVMSFQVVSNAGCLPLEEG